MTSVRSYFWLALACFNLFLAQPSQAVQSASVDIQATVTVVDGFTMNSFDENHPAWWSTTGNPSDYIGLFLIVVREGTDWDYTEYTFSLDKPNFEYHYGTFLPENFLANKDPYGEAEYASLTMTNHIIDHLYFADPELMMVASMSGRIDTASKFTNYTIRTFF